MDTMSVNGKDFTVIKLLGKGKGGYSYLVSDGEHNYVLKQIHHEPCSYYTFGNKIQSELNDYERLKNAGLRLPKLIDCDVENERILKDYIDVKTQVEIIQKVSIIGFVKPPSSTPMLIPIRKILQYFPILSM